MKIYRPLAPIKAISFDLDDTLYSNLPVMLAANEQMVTFFQSHLPKTHSYDLDFWLPYKNKALEAQPELIHDVVAVRLATYTLGLLSLGYSQTDAEELAAQAMAHFVYHRSNFSVPEKTHQLLKTLSSHFPLVAISNGNVDLQTIALDKYFTHIYHAGAGLKQKPDVDMFDRASIALKLEKQHILHVGDCGHADIFGAHNAGLQTAYLPKYKIGKPLKHLPNLWLDDVDELTQLIAQ